MSLGTVRSNIKASMKQIDAAIDQKLHQMVGFIIGRMEQYVPVDTGRLKASFYSTFDQASHVETIHIPVFYSIYQEFGTRFISPHPFVRPALLDAVQRYNLVNAKIILQPAPQISEPLRATTKGFILPTRQRLTARQKAHVKAHLIPISKRYARDFKRRGAVLSIIGPP